MAVAKSFSSEYHSRAAWHSFSELTSTISTCEATIDIVFEGFGAVAIRLDFESTWALSTSETITGEAFERFSLLK